MYTFYGNAQFGAGYPAGVMMGLPAWQELMKAIQAGYGTDVAALSGGGSLRLESLEHTLMATIQENKHFRLMNAIKKTPAGATVDQWVEQSSIGGRVGGAFNTELGDIASASGQYDRRVAFVKYLMTRRNVSVVQMAQESIVNAKAQEEINGSRELLTSAEWGNFYGDSSVVPEEYDGLVKILTDLNSVDHVIDMEGQPMDSNGFQKILEAAGTVYDFGQFGMPTDLYLSVRAQTDLDLYLDPAFRVNLDNNPASVTLGAPVKAIRTSFGDIATNPDVFVREGDMPAEAKSPATNTTSDPTKPQAVALAVASDASSKFGASHAGNYYYAVAGINKNGESDLRISAQQAIAAGEKCTLTITASAAQDETGYAIYRSRKNGSNNKPDFRLMTRIPRTGASTTFVDLNRLIPGTSIACVLNLAPSYNAIGWRQLMPMTRFQLYPTVKAEDPWAQLLFGYLRVTKARQHVLIKNILPKKVKENWDPFA